MLRIILLCSTFENQIINQIVFFLFRNMTQNQIFTLWSHTGDFAQMKIHSKQTQVSDNLIINAVKFVLLHNLKPICYWNVRFIQSKKLPNKFYEDYSFKILLTRRMLSIYGIKEELNFYNNLEFDGSEAEENNAKEFVSECAKAGLVFLDEACLAVPKGESGDVPEEIPLTSLFVYSVDELSNLKTKWDFEGVCNGDDVSPAKEANATISILKQELGKSYINFTYKLNIKCLIYC